MLSSSNHNAFRGDEKSSLLQSQQNGPPAKVSAMSRRECSNTSAGRINISLLDYDSAGVSQPYRELPDHVAITTTDEKHSLKSNATSSHSDCKIIKALSASAAKNILFRIPDSVTLYKILIFLNEIDLGHFNFTCQNGTRLISAYFGTSINEYKTALEFTRIADQFNSPIPLDRAMALNKEFHLAITQQIVGLRAEEEKEYQKPKSVVKRAVASVASFGAVAATSAYLFYRGVCVIADNNSNEALKSDYKKDYYKTCSKPTDDNTWPMVSNDIWSCDEESFQFFKPCLAMNYWRGCNYKLCNDSYSAYCAVPSWSDPTGWFAGGAVELVLGSCALSCLLAMKLCLPNRERSQKFFSSQPLSQLSIDSVIVDQIGDFLNKQPASLKQMKIQEVGRLLTTKLNRINREYSHIYHSLAGQQLRLFLGKKHAESTITIKEEPTTAEAVVSVKSP